MEAEDQKTIVITGGTGGIGLHSAIGLAKTRATLVVTGRNRERGEVALKQITQASGHDNVHLAIGDLSVQEGVRTLADDLLTRFPKIDVLINNAGLFATELRRTSDGFESDFAVNVAAPYLLTKRLLPALEAAQPARVLNVTGGPPTGPIDIGNLQAEKGFLGMSTYSHSKRAADAMSLALAKELEPKGVFVNVIYPGAASTSMTQAVGFGDLPWYMKMFYPLFLLVMRDDGGRGAAKAARSSIWGAQAPETVGRSGQYFGSNCKPAKFHASLLDPDNQAAVLKAIQNA